MSAQTSPSTAPKVPMRSCIGCRHVGPKSKLYRIRRSSDGVLSWDGDGNAPGRGAYVCSSVCFERARKGRSIERALRCRVKEDEFDAMASAVASWEQKENRE